jgi:fructose-bisphosphate aldolase class I
VWWHRYLSAAILDPETIHQKSSTNGKLFPEVLSELGIMPGIKPHLKVYVLPGQDGSTHMQVRNQPNKGGTCCKCSV